MLLKKYKISLYFLPISLEVLSEISSACLLSFKFHPKYPHP